MVSADTLMARVPAHSDAGRPTQGEPAPVRRPRVALLINFVAPYRIPLLQALAKKVKEFKVFASVPMEADRPWAATWADLDVTVQRTVTLTALHPHGDRALHIHVPYDTLPRLYRYDPDVIVSGELGLRSLQAALYRHLRPRSRLLIWATLSEHTERGWGLVRRLLRRFILWSADGVIVNGQSGARYIQGIRQSARVFVINQPADIALFSRPAPRPSHRGTIRLLYSGRIIRPKGVFEMQTAIAAWARAHPERHIEVSWAGDGEARARLEQAPLPANLTQHFTGYLGYADLAALYATCHALVFPTLSDEWGLVVNEALASGLVVLGSIYSQAVEEILEDGKTGWHFDPLQPGSIANALDRLLAATGEQLATMSRQARARGLALTPERAAGSMEAAIQAVLSDRLSPAASRAAPTTPQGT